MSSGRGSLIAKLLAIRLRNSWKERVGLPRLQGLSADGGRRSTELVIQLLRIIQFRVTPGQRKQFERRRPPPTHPVIPTRQVVATLGKRALPNRDDVFEKELARTWIDII